MQFRGGAAPRRRTTGQRAESAIGFAKNHEIAPNSLDFTGWKSVAVFGTWISPKDLLLGGAEL
jgi:hypothetical protein